MVKRDGIYYLENSEKTNLPTETDPSLASNAVREGEKYYVADTGEVGVFLNGRWVSPSSSDNTPSEEEPSEEEPNENEPNEEET